MISIYETFVSSVNFWCINFITDYFQQR